MSGATGAGNDDASSDDDIFGAIEAVAALKRAEMDPAGPADSHGRESTPPAAKAVASGDVSSSQVLDPFGDESGDWGDVPRWDSGREGVAQVGAAVGTAGSGAGGQSMVGACSRALPGAGECWVHVVETWRAHFVGGRLVRQGVVGEVLAESGGGALGVMPQLSIHGLRDLSASGVLVGARVNLGAVSEGFSPGTYYLNPAAVRAPEGHGCCRDWSKRPGYGSAHSRGEACPPAAACSAGVGGTAVMRYGVTTRRADGMHVAPPAALRVRAWVLRMEGGRAEVTVEVRLSVGPCGTGGGGGLDSVAVGVSLPRAVRDVVWCSPRAVVVKVGGDSGTEDSSGEVGRHGEEGWGLGAGEGKGRRIAAEWAFGGHVSCGSGVTFAVRGLTGEVGKGGLGCLEGVRAHAEGRWAGEVLWSGIGADGFRGGDYQGGGGKSASLVELFAE